MMTENNDQDHGDDKKQKINSEEQNNKNEEQSESGTNQEEQNPEAEEEMDIEDENKETQESVEKSKENEKGEEPEDIEPEIIENEDIDLEFEEEISADKKIELLTEEMEILKEERDKYYEQLTRLKADFANYRRRKKKEKKGLDLKAKIELLEEILPIIDNFERALESTERDDDFKEGIEKIYKHLVSTFKQQGLEIIETEDTEFDPRYHEAIMQVEDTEKESGIIVEEFQKGYMFQGKVIRPAMVKVAE